MLSHVSDVPSLTARSASSNSVGVAYTDDGQPYGGRGGAVYNSGADGSVAFIGMAIFKDNIGEMVRAHTARAEVLDRLSKCSLKF